MLAVEILQAVDWLIIVGVISVTLAAALVFTRRAGEGLEAFFVSGRSLPWWLAGTSIVATTFACDTPLAITELVRTKGIYGNWYWWCFAGGHILGVVMLARLWRRSRLVTDVSLIELRYAGRAATVLQVFRAGYFGIVWNMFTIGWVMRAMLAIFSAATGATLTGPDAALYFHGEAILTGPAVHVAAVTLLLGVAAIYSVFAGLWGVVVSDLIQFVIAMTGAIILAVFAVGQAGGMDHILATISAGGGDHTAIVPNLSQPWDLPVMTFFVYVGLLWYNDKTADSGGYIAQRLLAAKDERHGTLAMLWFVIAHYALRPWPWIVAALASMVLLPNVAHIDAYPRLIMTVLPVGLRGLLIASLLAAFISTVNTQLNWGASYLTRDVYMRLWRPNAAQRELVWTGRVVTLMLLALATVVSYYINSIEQAWKFLALLGAGSGLVLVGRWLWWRINAWSEIAVLAAALVGGLTVRVFVPWISVKMGCSWSICGEPPLTIPFALQLILVIGFSATSWIVATAVTAPAPRERLREFYRRTRPPGPGWRAIAAECGLSQPRGALPAIALAWALGVCFTFCALFGIGGLLLGQPIDGAITLAISAATGTAFYYANRHATKLMTPGDGTE